MSRAGCLAGLLLLIVSATTSCAPKQPRFVSLDSFRLVDAHHDSLHFQVAVTIENQDSRRSVLKDARYELRVDGVTRGNGRWEGSVDFVPNGKVSITLPLSVGSEDVDFWIDVLLNRNSLPVKIPLWFTADTGHGSWSFSMSLNPDVSMEGVFERWIVETAIQLNPRLESVSSPAVSLYGATLPVSISLENTYPFDIEVRTLELQLSITGMPVGDLASLRSITLPAQGRETLNIELHLNSLGPLASTTATLLRGELSYTLSGSAVLSMGDILVTTPVNTSGLIPVPGLF